jgi:hypothetical protein
MDAHDLSTQGAKLKEELIALDTEDAAANKARHARQQRREQILYHLGYITAAVLAGENMAKFMLANMAASPAEPALSGSRPSKPAAPPSPIPPHDKRKRRRARRNPYGIVTNTARRVLMKYADAALSPPEVKERAHSDFQTEVTTTGVRSALRRLAREGDARRIGDKYAFVRREDAAAAQ